MADPKYVNGLVIGHHFDLHQNYKSQNQAQRELQQFKQDRRQSPAMC